MEKNNHYFLNSLLKFPSMKSNMRSFPMGFSAIFSRIYTRSTSCRCSVFPLSLVVHRSNLRKERFDINLSKSVLRLQGLQLKNLLYAGSIFMQHYYYYRVSFSFSLVQLSALMYRFLKIGLLSNLYAISIISHTRSF